MRHLLTDLRGNPIYSFAQRRLRRIRHFHTTTLFCKVQNRAWADVLRRAHSHPHEIVLQDDVTGNTPLHVACRLDPPPDVIKALQATCRVRNHEGATPLHIAASHRCSAESLRVLLECASNCEGETKENNDLSPTAELSRMGRAPIHYACMSFRGLEIDAFRLLLDATLKEGFLTVENEQKFDLDDLMIDEEFEEEFFDDKYYQPPPEKVEQGPVIVNVMSMKDATGQTPLGLLFRRYRERVRCVISTIDRVRTEHAEAPDRASLAAALAVHADLGELWEKARFIVARLTAERLQREGDNTDANHVLPCPLSPGEAAVAQEAAAWAAEKYRNSELAEDDLLSIPEDTASSSSGSRSSSPVPVPRQFRIVHASVALTGYGCPPEMIRLAISIHPHQVREMDEDGNLPLHIAVTASSYLAAATDLAAVTAASSAMDATSDEMSVLSDAAMSFFSSATISQTTNPFDKVIKILLQHYHQAAEIPQGRTGRLPFVLAIESGKRSWKDGLRTLLNAYPPALHNKRLIEPPVYPNLLALVTSGHPGLLPSCLDIDLLSYASPRKSSKSKKLRQEANARSTLFQLLRTKPEWLTEEGWKSLE